MALADEEEETHRNLGCNPETDKSIDKITSIENHHRHASRGNQRARFYQDDGDRFAWGGT